MNIHTLTTSLVDKYSLCMGLHFLCVCYFLILPQKWRFFVTQTTCTRDRKNVHKNSVDRISYLRFCRLTQLKYPPRLYIDFWLYPCYCKKYFEVLMSIMWYILLKELNWQTKFVQIYRIYDSFASEDIVKNSMCRSLWSYFPKSFLSTKIKKVSGNKVGFAGWAYTYLYWKAFSYFPFLYTFQETRNWSLICIFKTFVYPLIMSRYTFG